MNWNAFHQQRHKHCSIGAQSSDSIENLSTAYKTVFSAIFK